MILFVNVFITNIKKHPFRYDRYGLPESNRLDIFKYSLASWAALNPVISKAIIYCALGPAYASRWNELEIFVKDLFGDKLSLHKGRNTNTREWRSAGEEILNSNDNLIWFTCNDDHVFLDYDLSMIEEVIQLMNAETYPYVTCFHSHWIEGIRYLAKGNPTNHGKFASAMWNMHDAIQIVNKKLFHHWWYVWDFGHRDMTRTDQIKFIRGMQNKVYLPFRELTRHFDGYSHAMHAADLCPPLSIPAGFFENDMKILYCSNERKIDWISLNPLKPFITQDKRNGVHYKWLLNEIPLFWKDRISQIETPNFYSKGMLIRARHKHLQQLTTVRRPVGNVYYPVIPQDWFVNSNCLYPPLPTPKLL